MRMGKFGKTCFWVIKLSREKYKKKKLNQMGFVGDIRC